jgi:hypothetical protein
MSEKLRNEVLVTIDELNQYLNGNVTKTSLQETLSELLKELLLKKFPFNEETDCKEKYNEVIQDYLYEEIITKIK